jgi:glycosyltransferase involved in cell wall biosynthesis
MKIALLSYEYPPETGFGGIGTYTFYQARALARLGHRVHVFAGAEHARRTTTTAEGGVTVTRLRKVGPVERLARSADRLRLWWWKNRLQTAANTFAAVRSALSSGQFDVVEMPECGGEGALLNHCLDLPTVVRLHSPAELIMPTYDTKALDRVLTGTVERLGISGARALSSCSRWLAEEVRGRMAVRTPIEVIPNGIDLALFDRDEGIDIHERFGIPRDRVKVFFANRLEERKGIHIVRDLIGDVLEQHPDAAFVLAGADSSSVVERELKPALAARNLRDGLYYVGKLELGAVRACLKQCDVFLLPSIWENAPYSLLEAMAAGKAIVASDCGGVPEILRHEVDGLVARTGDVDSFRRALERLLRSDSVRRRFGRSARQRVEARFSDEIVARRSLAFYEWALGTPDAARSARAAGPRAQLGPDDWFQVWWLREDTVRQPLALARGDDGAPRLAGLTLEQLAFVRAVLERTYWERAGRSDTAEAQLLDDLAALQQQLAERARDRGTHAATERLALPALTHPAFGDDLAAAAVIDELWRLREGSELREWLGRELAVADFAERAVGRVSWRRLAVLHARLDPGPASYDLLRRIYRTIGTHARIVQQDRDYIDSGAKGREFGAAIEALGLHAPLQRPKVFGRQKATSGETASGDADITVLIPAFRHERYVAQAMQSVLDQDHAALRLLVVDDCSPDGTVEAARAVPDARVEVRINDRNLGLGRSIDAALKTIETPYVALLNSDDLFHPHRLRECLAVLEASKKIALVATGLETMDDQGRRLEVANSCAVDIGPNAHAWVRWYDGVCRALDDTAWTSLPALLAHNHLATSSNVVCRTDFLVKHRREFRDLDYSVDWMLFLLAALEDKLAFLPEPLLGYRLHSANTVWFDDAGRAGYVHEVNRVVARVLALLATKRKRARASKEAIFEELAGLLREHVARHGETDGYALFLAQLAGGPRPPRGEGDPAQHERLAHEALRRKQLERFAPADAPAWELARLREEAVRLRIQSHLAEAAAPLAGRLVAEIGNVRSDLEATRERVGDTDAMREAIDARASQLTAERDATVEQARAEVQQARETADRQITDARTAHERELEKTRQARDHLDASLRKTTEERNWSESERVRLLAELTTARRELDDSQQRLLWKHGEQRAQMRELHDSYEYRLGRLLLGKLRLRGPFKTVLRAAVHARVRGGRALALTGRAVRGRSSRPTRVVLACDGAFPSPADDSLADEARALLDAGIDTRILCLAAGPRAALPPDARAILRHRRVLGADAALAVGDRRYFEKRRADALATAEALVGAPRLGRACTFARSAKALGAAYVHAWRLGPAAIDAWAASRLLAIPYGISVSVVDLEAPSLEAPLAARILADATLVTADGPHAAAAARAAPGGAGEVIVKPPLVHANGAVRPRPTVGACTIACIAPRADTARMTAIADAVQRAAARGAEVRIQLALPPTVDAAEIEAFEALVRRARALGVAERIETCGGTEPANVAALLERAGALLELGGCGEERRRDPSPALARAMAAGVAVIGCRAALEGLVLDGVEGLLLDDCEPQALADALVAIATDASLRQRLGYAARGRFDAELAPDAAGAAFRARVAKLLGLGLG